MKISITFSSKEKTTIESIANIIDPDATDNKFVNKDLYTCDQITGYMTEEGTVDVIIDDNLFCKVMNHSIRFIEPCKMFARTVKVLFEDFSKMIKENVTHSYNREKMAKEILEKNKDWKPEYGFAHDGSAFAINKDNAHEFYERVRADEEMCLVNKDGVVSTDPKVIKTIIDGLTTKNNDDYRKIYRRQVKAANDAYETHRHFDNPIIAAYVFMTDEKYNHVEPVFENRKIYINPEMDEYPMLVVFEDDYVMTDIENISRWLDEHNEKC